MADADPDPTPLDILATTDLAAEVVEMARTEDLTLAVAESLTGGLLALRLTETPRSGEVFVGGIVAYTAEVKQDLLDVPEGPVVSASSAEAMAAGVARVFGAQVAAATTGVAGPDTLEGKPVGTVFIGWCVDGETGSALCRLNADLPPEEVRARATDAALNHLRHRLLARLAGAGRPG